ncbi:hypothetical protein FRB99_005080 [Tulasnella sp. 403]|nr:hypothetical protein FRB99_005080 [Tulasnella sp. 403]
MLNPKVFLEDPKLLASMKDRLTSRLPVVKPILEFTFAICKSSDHAAKRLKQEGFEAAVKQAKQDLESLSVSQENIDVATREITSILQAMEK